MITSRASSKPSSSRRSSAASRRDSRDVVQIELTPQQYEFAAADAPLVGFVGGRGSGKTFAGAWRILRRAKPGGHYLVVAPTYPMLRDFAWPTLVELARKCCMLRRALTSRMQITLRGGAQILCRTADRPDRLRGLTVSAAWIDEASLVPREVLDVVLFTLREAERPSLASTFTPKGQRHWTYERFGTPGPGRYLVHADTWSNPFLPQDFLDLVEREASGRLADQELRGLFVSMEGAEWPQALWGDWVFVPPHQMPQPDEHQVRLIGVDPSLGKSDREGDYSAIVCVGTARGLVWVQADLARRSPQNLVHDTLAACERFKPLAVAIEANQFQELLVHEFERQAAGRFGVAWPAFAIKNTAPKLLRIRRLGSLIIRRELRVQDDPGGRLLVGQLQDFPHGAHDDGPDALEMALRLLWEA
jgi:predicted phage terminase large subunit-like protein